MLEVTPTLRRARPRKNIEIPKETWKLYGLGGGECEDKKEKEDSFVSLWEEKERLVEIYISVVFRETSIFIIIIVSK